MKHARPSDVSSGVDQPPPAMEDLDATQVHGRIGAEAFVVSAYEAHHAELFGFLAKATRDRSVAEELLQETFLRLMAEARAGRAPVQVRAWLYRVAANLVIGRSRRQATALRWLGRNGPAEHDRTVAPSPEAGVLSRERAAEMDRVLDGLSGDARLALLLSGDGFTGEEIAAAIGRSESATRTLLSRARARVRVRRALFAEERQ